MTKTSTAKRILCALWARVGNDNVGFLAGGVAFYALLAIFPAMAALVSLFGLFADAQMVGEQMQAIKRFLPADVYDLLFRQLQLLVAQPRDTLSLTAIFSLLLTLYSATKGTNALLAALNMIFNVAEDRSWWKQHLVSFAMTIGSIIMLVLTLAAVVAIPLFLDFASPTWRDALIHSVTGLRWLLLGATLFFGLLVLFAFGPNRPLPRSDWRVIAIGAFFTSCAWIGASALLSWGLQFLPELHAAYGSLSAVVGLMTWMLVSANIVLWGGAVIDVFERRHLASNAPIRA